MKLGSFPKTELDVGVLLWSKSYIIKKLTNSIKTIDKGVQSHNI